MKLAAGLVLFLLCGLWGERRGRALMLRERAIKEVRDLMRQVSDRQLFRLCSFEDALREVPQSRARETIQSCLKGEACGPLSSEERAMVARYARLDVSSVEELRRERNALLDRLEKDGAKAAGEQRKGQVYRSVGYLLGAAALLLIV